MVLDEGRLIEFDTPHKLLERESGMFRALSEESRKKSRDHNASTSPEE